MACDVIQDMVFLQQIICCHPHVYISSDAAPERDHERGRGAMEGADHRKAELRHVAGRLGSSVTTAWHVVVVACAGAGYVTCNMEFGEMRFGEDKEDGRE